MPFEKGHKKQGGRKKGVQNKMDSSAKTALKNFVDDEIKNLPAIVADLNEKERTDLLVKLLPYVYAKPQETTPKAEITALLASVETLTETQLIRLKQIIIECNAQTANLN